VLLAIIPAITGTRPLAEASLIHRPGYDSPGFFGRERVALTGAPAHGQSVNLCALDHVPHFCPVRLLINGAVRAKRSDQWRNYAADMLVVQDSPKLE